ncbi:MAG: glutathione S-transferase family protein [Gammaproteobacteria bacterium]|nr:glutathione S-transferase family protein [Gammaproteobacteria bacterium]
MLTLYGAPQSNADRSAWLLYEANVAFDYQKLDLRSAEGRAAFAKINPALKMPYLVDGDVQIGESIAINFYIAEKYAPTLWGDTPEQRAQIYYWSLFAITNLLKDVLEVLGHTRVLAEELRSPKLAERSKDLAIRYLAVIEEALKDEYLLGSRFTVADVNVGSVVHLADRIKITTLGPRTSAWLARLRARPAYQKAYGA